MPALLVALLMSVVLPMSAASAVTRAGSASDGRAATIGAGTLAGTWNTTDPATRGVVRVDIAATGSGTTVRLFGACSPTPCDWGTVSGRAYAPNVSATNTVAFSASYQFGFKQTIVTGVLENGLLVLQTYDHFTDASGRSDYYSRGYFSRGLV